MKSKAKVEVLKDVPSHLWYKAIPCFKEELLKRLEEGSDECLDNWLDKLEYVYTMEGAFVVLLTDNETVVGCAMVHPALNLHYDDLCSIFGLVAKEGYGSLLLRSIIQTCRELGYLHLHVSHKVDLRNYRTSIINL